MLIKHIEHFCFLCTYTKYICGLWIYRKNSFPIRSFRIYHWESEHSSIYSQTHSETYIYIYIHTNKHTHPQIHTNAQNTHIDTHTHEHIPSYIHTYTHLYPYIYIRCLSPAVTSNASSLRRSWGLGMKSSFLEAFGTNYVILTKPHIFLCVSQQDYSLVIQTFSNALGPLRPWCLLLGTSLHTSSLKVTCAWVLENLRGPWK